MTEQQLDNDDEEQIVKRTIESVTIAQQRERALELLAVFVNAHNTLAIEIVSHLDELLDQFDLADLLLKECGFVEDDRGNFSRAGAVTSA